MKLSQVLSSIKSSDTVKTAASTSDATTEKTAAASTGDKLKAALHEATSSPSATVKQATASPSPIEGLTKVASQIASAEHESIVKEANLYGAAVADGFMARMAMYDTAAEKVAATQPVSTKTAATSDGDFEKFAAENPDLVKEAAEVGYRSTMQQMEKLAEVAHAKGHDEAVLTIYKTAHASVIQGFEDTVNVLKSLPR